MPVKVVIIGDTHVSSFEQLPLETRQAFNDADWLVHVGDYTSISVLKGLVALKGQKFIGVYGNADPLDVRSEVPSKRLVTIQGKKIGITHPVSGRDYDTTEKKALAEFFSEPIDVLVFGHTHDPKIELLDKILVVNPGKGYLEQTYFGPPTTLIVLTIDKKEKNICGIIQKIER